MIFVTQLSRIFVFGTVKCTYKYKIVNWNDSRKDYVAS